MDWSTPGFPVHHHLPELAQTHVHWVSDAIHPSRPRSSPSSCLQSFAASGSFPMSHFFPKWPKYWSFSISPSHEYSQLISFRMDWLDLLAVQGTLKSLLQHHSSKASILWCSAFFMVQLSHPYIATGKTYFWLYRPLLAKWCLCFLLCFLIWCHSFSSKEQASFNFMAAVTICSDLGTQENSLSLFLFPHLYAMKWWDHMPWS